MTSRFVFLVHAPELFTETFIPEAYHAPHIEFEKDHLMRLVPMLYVCKYDPNETIRILMRALWDKLFGVDTKQLLMQPFVQLLW